MKRLLIVWLVLCLAAACALSEGYEIGNPDEMNVHYACVDFTGEMPEAFEKIFAPRLREGDRTICGTKVEQSYYNEPTRDAGASALLALEREGKLLILGAHRTGKTWTAAIETDSFVPAGTALSMTALPEYGGLYGTLINAQPAIVIGEEAFRVTVLPDGSIEVNSLSYPLDDGRTMRVSFYPARIFCEITGEPCDVLYSGNGVTPRRLGAWTADAFPRNETQAEYYHLNNAFALKENEAFITGVNLRERPTGSAPSWGTYAARVTVLGSEPGLQMPWYHVQVGSLTGWVSGAYLVREPGSDRRYYTAASMALPVARADQAAALRAKPGEAAGETVPAGTLMHVLQEKDGWLHVIVPRCGYSWAIDWYGAYGFVKASEATVGVSPADLRWR